MSHFTVLVVTDTPDQVAAALQPFHEYECTGTEDQYVVFVDEHDKLLKEWNDPENTDDAYRAADGTVYDGYEEIFYREPTDEEKDEIGPMAGSGCGKGLSWASKDWDDGRGYRTKVREVPADFEKFQRHVSEVYANIGEYAKEYHGYDVIQNGRIGRMTNPNAKWDWWQIGGRWSGLLKPKDPAIGEKGSTGLMGSEYDSAGVDQCIKSNVDFDGRMKEAAEDAARDYDAKHEIIAGRTWKTWIQCREEAETIDAARDMYHDQQALIDLKATTDGNPFLQLDKYLVNREAFIQTAANSAISTFAVVMDGKWYERGDMGWFGCVAGEKDQETWNGEFKALLDTIPDDKCLTIVDCHI